MARLCSKCKLENKEFYNGKSSWCKDCLKAKAKLPTLEQRRKNLWNKYRITLEQFDEMLAAQDGKCAICRKPYTTNKQFAVDHDHITGAIRGILCANCNIGMRFVDEIGWIDQAIEYKENTSHES